jgi:hypothetical protein
LLLRNIPVNVLSDVGLGPVTCVYLTGDSHNSGLREERVPEMCTFSLDTWVLAVALARTPSSRCFLGWKTERVRDPDMEEEQNFTTSRLPENSGSMCKRHK